MAQQFLSRSARELGSKEPTTGAIGPGEYNIDSSIKKSKPGFTGFSSSARRSGDAVDSNRIVEITPGPGEHDVNKLLGAQWSKSIKSSFRSGTNRFKSSISSDTPAPTAYTIPSSINVKKKKHYRKTKINVDVVSLNPAVVPSIPTRHQSYGYEAGNDGKMQLQDPIVPGYAGVGNDTVGPGDYDPKVNFKFSSEKTAHISKTKRDYNAGIVRDRLTNPGPGYYNHQSSFEDFANIAGSASPEKSDYYVKLNNSMKRHPLSSFESKSKREFINEQVVASLPGPGNYSLPKSKIDQIQESKVPKHLQCFSSSDMRFKDSVPRSMKLSTAPGAYNPLTSDFEKQRLKILKQKKMASRSGWVQNIAFSGTEKRFMDVNDSDKVTGPTPTSYDPKVGLVDDLNRHNNKYADTRVHGGFGVNAKRFEENKVINHLGAQVAPRSEHEYGGQALGGGGDINIGFEGVPTVANGGGGAASSSLRKGKINRPKYASSNFVNNESRFFPVRDAQVPAPGSYDTSLKWNEAKGVPTMKSNKTVSLKKFVDDDSTPGPGDYNIALSYVKKAKNRKNVLVSTSNRFTEQKGAEKNLSPTPMSYNPHGSLYGTLVKPSHNVLLTGQ